MVNILNEKDFEKEVLNFDGVVLIDFYADWCGPCKMLSPIIEEVSEEHPEVRFLKVNVDNSPMLASEFGIVSIPTLVAIKDKKIIAQNVGYCTKDAVVGMIL